MAHSLSTLFNSLINPKRDFVSANTPTDQLLKTFLDMPERASRSVSYSTSGGATQDPGYGWPDLPPEFAEVSSQEPQAKARGELNEETLRDYKDAMDIYNQGGKAERILSLISGLATTGGYIADRTSGDPARRASAGGPGGDLDYALQGAFGLPNMLNQKRRDKMTKAMGWADTQRGLRGESIGAMSSAKDKDNYWNYMFRTAGAKAGQERARIGAGRSAPKPLTTEDQLTRRAQKMFYGGVSSTFLGEETFPGYINDPKFQQPHQLANGSSEPWTEQDILDEFYKEHPKEAKNMGKEYYEKDYQTPGDTYTDWEDKIEGRIEKRFGQRRKDAGSDPEELKRIDFEEEQYRQVLWDRVFRIHGQGGKKPDIGPPMAQPGDEVTPEEGRGVFDVLGDMFGGVYEGGKEGGLIGGVSGGIKGLFGMDEDTAAAVGGVAGEQGDQIISEDDEGYTVQKSDGSTEWVRKPRSGAPEEEESRGGLDFGDMLEFLNTLK